MENYSKTTWKVVPVTRKKLLAQALLKDSPLKLSLNKRDFEKKHGKSSSYQLENISSIKTPAGNKIYPLIEKDMNLSAVYKDISRKSTKNNKEKFVNSEEFFTNVPDFQKFVVNLWKFSKMGSEGSSLKFGISQVLNFQNFSSECSKVKHLTSELIHSLRQSNVFPDHLSPYLEEIICWIPMTYPLITPESPISECECLLSISIHRFSATKIKVKNMQKLKKNESPSTTILVYCLLLILSQIDLNLQLFNRKLENFPWELFIECSSNLGLFIQNIRKIPEYLMQNNNDFQSKLYLEIIAKALISFSKIPCFNDEEGEKELRVLLEEIFETNRIVLKNNGIDLGKNQGSLLNIELNLLSERSSISSKISENRITTRKKSHSRSLSNTIILKKPKVSHKSLKFMQESRFNKRVLEKLTTELVKKMKGEPDYLFDLKEKDIEKYLQFKNEFIEENKEKWMHECIKELESSDLLTISNENDLKIILAKKETLISDEYNKDLLRNIIEKAKELSLRISP